ncbi:MAG: hypothetical protein ACPG52_02930 [Cognaticolwellia sp.]
MTQYFAIILMLLLTLTGCSKTVEVALDPEVNVFISASSKDHIILTAKNAEYVILNNWLAQQQANWLPTSGRYAGGVYLTSGNYGIQITDSKVVLYANITDKPTAIYAQEIERSELKMLKNLAKN